jgi:hypothetical protein
MLYQRSNALTCEDFGLDFKHSAAWCPVCWSEELQSKAVEIERRKWEEMKRDNDINEYQDKYPAPYRPAPAPPPPSIASPTTNPKRGGVVPIEPRRD